jgi:organic radical activating enzyme
VERYRALLAYRFRLLVLSVSTGDEPLLQHNEEWIDELHKVGFLVAVETNGALEPPRGIDWICVSPKHGTEAQDSGRE